MPTATKPVDTTLADKVMRAIIDTMGYLKGRWADEKEHESWADYVAKIRQVFEGIEGVTFEGFTKKPFAVSWMGHDGYKRVSTLKRNALTTVRYGK